MTDIIHAPHSLDDLTDNQLVTLTRGGNLDAYGVLYSRHTIAAVRLARYYKAGVDADDVAAEAFMAVLSAIQRGNGPTESFSGYLLTAVRRELGRRAKAAKRVRPVADVTDVPVFADDEPESVDRLRQAFASLLPAHQRILWQLEVEGMKPRELAVGRSANGVSAAGSRARSALRKAFVDS